MPSKIDRISFSTTFIFSSWPFETVVCAMNFLMAPALMLWWYLRSQCTTARLFPELFYNTPCTQQVGISQCTSILNETSFKLCAEIQQQSMHWVHHECLVLLLARCVVRLYLNKTDRTLQKVTLLVIPVNSRFPRKHYLLHRNCLNVSKCLEFTGWQAAPCPLCATTHQNIFAARQQHLL